MRSTRFEKACDRGMSGQDIIDAGNLRAHGISAAYRVARQLAKWQITEALDLPEELPTKPG